MPAQGARENYEVRSGEEYAVIAVDVVGQWLRAL